MQEALISAGAMRAGEVDGWYGQGTAAAVRAFQAAKSVAVTGDVDTETWTQLLPGTVIPSLAERCLALTAAFEGHDYTLAVGNFDGAWLTWGIIGFTLKHGEIQKIFAEIASRFPGFIGQDFGSHAAEINAVMRGRSAKQQHWAESVSTPQGLLTEPWRTAFRLLGSRAEVQQIQQRLAVEDYFVPATQAATRLGLSSELGIALCFDIQVQNGGIKKSVTATLKGRAPEMAQRVAIAKAVAANARQEFRDDVLQRKLTIACGAGAVHGSRYQLENWGLAELPAALTINAKAENKDGRESRARGNHGAG